MTPPSYRFECEQVLRWVDVDAAGVVNHAIFFTLAEQTRFEYFRRLDLVYDDVPPFLLGATAARFEKSGRFGMRVFVRARTTRLGGKSLDMEYEVVRRGDVAKPATHSDRDERLVTITATLVYVDEQLRSCEIPAEARRAIAAFEGIPERAAPR